MSTSTPTPLGSLEEAVVLAGRSSFEAYLALAALRPQHAHVAYGADYVDAAHRLARVAIERLGVPCKLLPVADDASFASVIDAWAHVPQGAHLHYTDGTGVLGAAMRAAFAADGRPLSGASSLDHDRRLLRLDDGARYPLELLVPSSAVDIDAVLALGGFEGPHRPERVAERDARLADLMADALGRFHPKRHMSAGAMLHELARRLRDQVRDDPDGAVRDWPNGRFFEDLVRHFVLEVAPHHDVRSGIRVHRAGLRAELDVVAVGHYRPYVISCAVGGRYDTVRMKMFEVLHRARQVGGPAARCAIACTLAEHAELSPDELEALARDSPEPADQPVVFGAQDIAGWLLGDERALAQLADFVTA